MMSGNRAPAIEPVAVPFWTTAVTSQNYELEIPRRHSEGDPMAETSSASNNTLYFIVGGLVVIVAGVAFLYFGGHMPGSTAKTSITIEVPKITP